MEPAAAPVVQGHPGIDVVRVVPHVRGWRRIAADLALARELRRARFDLVVDFHGGPRASFLTRATGAPRRVGYAVKGRSWMYTDVVPRPADLRPRHSVENQWDLLAHLGRPIAAAPDRVRHRVRMDEAAEAGGLRHEPPRRGRHRCRAPARRRPRERRKPLSPLAVEPLRPSWLCNLRQNDPDRRIILTSGPSEAEAARAIVAQAWQRLPEGAGDRIRAGDEYTLAELRSLVARAAVYVGGDSGPLHVAATSDVR